MQHRLEKQSPNLKVIAFKLPEDQLQQIKSLCDQGFYPSLSETIRIAITDYISYILDFTEQNEAEFWLNATDHKNLSEYTKNSTPKISACTKMPIELLNTIDSLLKKNSQFSNRTNFIRLAVNRFLENDSQIYSHWLNKRYKSSAESMHNALT